MPGGGLRKIPYISKNPAYDSFKCDCGAFLRSKSPNVIERHQNTMTHKHLTALPIASYLPSPPFRPSQQNTNERRPTGQAI